MKNIFDSIRSSDVFAFMQQADFFDTILDENKNYNPLTYSIYQKNMNSFKSIFTQAQTYFSSEELVKLILPDDTLQVRSDFVDLFSPIDEKKEFFIYFLNNIELTEEKKTQMTPLIAGFKKIEEEIPFDLILDKLLNSDTTYENIQQKNAQHLFSKYYQHYQVPENECLLAFKDYLNHYEEYQTSISFSNGDYFLESFKEMTQQMDNEFNQVKNIQDLNDIFSKNGTLAKIKKEYDNMLKLFEEKATERQENVIYLFNDNFFQKYLIYSNAIGQDTQSENHILNVMKENYFNNYFYPRYETPIEDKKEIEKNLMDYGFKGASISKFVNLENVAQFIIQGAQLVQDIYKLRAKEVGGEQLYLNFTHQGSNCGGAASYVLGANMINHYNLNTHNPEKYQNKNQYLMQCSSHFLHEYSHYLQDLKYQAYELMKKSGGQKNLYQQIDFGDISHNLELTQIIDSILSYPASFDETFECSYKMIKFYFPEIEKTSFQSFFNENYHDFTQKESETALKLLIENAIKDVEELNETTQIVIEYLDVIKKGYDNSKFSQYVWQETDKKQGHIYLNNPFEIHSRLVESMAQLPVHIHPNPHFYPMPQAIQNVKPKLEKFNALLVENYREILQNHELQKNTLDNLTLRNKISQFRQPSEVKNFTKDDKLNTY